MTHEKRPPSPGICTLFTGLVAFGQPPQDIRGFDKFTWGMSISQAQSIYPGRFKFPKIGKHTPAQPVERLRIDRFAVGNREMTLHIFTRGDDDGIAQIELTSGDTGGIIGAYVRMVFTASLGAETGRSGLSSFWRFPSTSIYLITVRDSSVDAIFRPPSADQKPVVEFPK